jgi:hypothetical protein
MEAPVSQDQQSRYKTEDVTYMTKLTTLCTHSMRHSSNISVHIITTCHTKNSLHSNRAQMCLIKITVCRHHILARFLTFIRTHCTLELCSNIVQYTLTNTRHMASNLQTLCDCKFLDTEVQTRYSISCSENQIVAWRDVPTPNCSMMVVLPFFQLTTVFTEQSIKLCVGQMKWNEGTPYIQSASCHLPSIIKTSNPASSIVEHFVF